MLENLSNLVAQQPKWRGVNMCVEVALDNKQ